MIDHAWHLIRKYNLNNGSNKVFVDASPPGFIRSLKNAEVRSEVTVRSSPAEEIIKCAFLTNKYHSNNCINGNKR